MTSQREGGEGRARRHKGEFCPRRLRRKKWLGGDETAGIPTPECSAPAPAAKRWLQKTEKALHAETVQALEAGRLRYCYPEGKKKKEKERKEDTVQQVTGSKEKQEVENPRHHLLERNHCSNGI